MVYPTRNATIAVGVTSVTPCGLVPPGMKRILFALTNISTAAQVITIALGDQVAVAGKGIVLSPGCTFIESTTENYECSQEAIQAIADAAAGNLAVVERFI